MLFRSERLLRIQKSEDKLLLNNFTLDSLLNDDDSVEAIFKNNSLYDELNDSIEHPLQSAYSHAQEDAYWSECYDEIYSSIVDSGYADNFKSGSWQVKPNRRGDQYKFEITQNLKKVLYEWLSEYENYSDNIAYQGNYIGFIQQLGDFEYQTAWAPDYADHSKTIKSLNNDFIREEF